jgi:hypothetical protein
MMTTQVLVETVQFIMKKYPTMNFFEAVEKVAEITGIVLEVRRAKRRCKENS